MKNLCLLLGYDLIPEVGRRLDGDLPNLLQDEEKKDKSMDDTLSFIEAATGYLIEPKSPLIETHPEVS